jgi:hypothetical protein
LANTFVHTEGKEVEEKWNWNLNKGVLGEIQESTEEEVVVLAIEGEATEIGCEGQLQREIQQFSKLTISSTYQYLAFLHGQVGYLGQDAEEKVQFWPVLFLFIQLTLYNTQL